MILFLLATKSFAAVAPYASLVCPDDPGCEFKLQGADPSGKFAIYLVVTPLYGDRFGELVSIPAKRALNFVGGGRGCSLGEGGCSDGIQVRSARFLSVDSIPLARFDIGFGELSVDFCGRRHILDFLTGQKYSHARLPHAEEWFGESARFQGSRVTFEAYGALATVDLHRPVADAYPLQSVSVNNGGSQFGVFLARTKDGDERFFEPRGDSVTEYFVQPDGSFDTVKFCPIRAH